MSETGIWVAATAAEIRDAEEPVLARLGDDPLMDRAAEAIAAAARVELRAARVAGARIVVLVGTGKNGGDALLAAARLAQDRTRAAPMGATATIPTTTTAAVTAVLTGATAHERGLSEARAAGVAIIEVAREDEARAALRAATLVIDGIVGLGTSAGLRESAASLVEAIPVGIHILAVDLPSGLDPDTRHADLHHVRASVTVTFTAPKLCLLLPPAALDAGLVIVADVGIPVPDTAPDAPRRLSPAGAAAWWPVPTARDSKYSRGVVGVIAGSDSYPGAAVLTSSAAVRAGAGLVRYLGPRRAQDLVLAARPEVIVAEPSDSSAELPKVDAWVLGPGVADDPAQEAAVVTALASGLPAVVDAGAIDGCVEARVGGDRRTPADRLLLTPHAGELERALAIAGAPATRTQIEADPAFHTLALARLTDATVLLKGAVTLVASPDGTLWSQADGPAWLATGGAGDVLAGIAGTLLAAGLPADRAGALAALVHGRAAALASGGGPIAALDVADAMPSTIEALKDTIGGLVSSH